MIHFLLVASEGAINSVVVCLPCSASLLCTCSTLGRSYEVPARLWLDVMAVALLRQCWQTDFWGKCVWWHPRGCSRCTNLSITWDESRQAKRPPNKVCPCLLTSSPFHPNLIHSRRAMLRSETQKWNISSFPLTVMLRFLLENMLLVDIWKGIFLHCIMFSIRHEATVFNPGPPQWICTIF